MTQDTTLAARLKMVEQLLDEHGLSHTPITVTVRHGDGSGITMTGTSPQTILREAADRLDAVARLEDEVRTSPHLAHIENWQQHMAYRLAACLSGQPEGEG